MADDRNQVHQAWLLIDRMYPQSVDPAERDERDPDRYVAARYDGEDPWVCPKCGYAPEPGHLHDPLGEYPHIRLYHRDHVCG